MGLFDFLKKKAPKNTNNNLTETKNGWSSLDAYATYHRPNDDKLYELSIAAANAKSIDGEIACLRAFIAFYYHYKNECISKGEGYFKYFSDMHMHCHNSRNPDFDFATPREERLEYILQNYDILIKEEQEKIAKEAKKQELLQNTDLEKSIKEIITANPGILQSDLYKKYDPILKDSISEFLYFSAKNNRIRREKSGRSYQLFWDK
jgi:hypothetical protein